MNTSQPIADTKREFNILLACDFLSSFGSCFLGTAAALFKYRELRSLLLASFFPAMGIAAQVFAFFVNRYFTFKLPFRFLFFTGEVLAGLFALSLFFIGNKFIPMLIAFSVYSLLFAVLEAYRAEFLKAITSNEQMPRRQSISQAVNTAVVIAGSLAAGFAADKVMPETMYLTTAAVYVFPAFLILFLSGKYRPIIQTGEMKKAAESAADMPKLQIHITDKTFLFAGSMMISFFGGAASLLTLSYILNTLNSAAFNYAILMSALSLGSVAGSLLINIPSVKKNLKVISACGIAGVGGLLLCIFFKPDFLSLLAILTVSGVISSLSMTYYAISLFTLYNQSDIRKKYNLLQLTLQSSSALSKPAAGLIEKYFGITIAFAICGAGFILTAPINYLRRNKNIS